MHPPVPTAAAVAVAMAAAAAVHTMAVDRMAAALTNSNSYNHSYRGGRNARRVFYQELDGRGIWPNVQDWKLLCNGGV